MRWYINHSGQSEGPYEEGVIVGWIRNGALRNAAICREGSSDWVSLGSHTPFAEALAYPAGPSSWELEPVRAISGTLKIDDPDEPAVSSRPSSIPPPQHELGDRAPPLMATRTPSKPLEGVGYTGDIPEDAPAWMHHAQRMIAGLQQALSQGTISPATEAGIERAFAGWELDGSNERQIARLALMLEQAHGAVRGADAERLPQVAADAAQLVYRAMPKHARRRVQSDEVTDVVRRMYDNADEWVAVVDATAELLGWSRAASAHAAYAVRLAIEGYRSKKGGAPPSSG